MKALVLEGVQKLAIKEVPTPQLAPLGALIRIQANGVCRSDWHAWMGDIPRTYPMVLGHEMAGIVEEVAPGVCDIKRGDRVVVPFNGSDGTCPYCQKGLSHLCDNALIPGRSYSGGYAEYVSVPLADRNLVTLPDEVSFAEGASLGCRYMTSFHALVDRADIQPGEWVVIMGCGGVGLSAINIAASLGCRVIGVDVNPANLELATQLGAEMVINSKLENPVEAVLAATKIGAHVSVDALGITQTCTDGLLSLRKGGRHIQIGITTKADAGYMRLPTDLIVYKELQLIGSLGMPSHRYDAMLPMIVKRQLNPAKLVTREIGLKEVQSIFEGMSNATVNGTFVVTDFN